MSNGAVALQGVWSGDVEEEHRHSGGRLPSNAHHRIEGSFLRFGRPHQRDARHSKSLSETDEESTVRVVDIFILNGGS